MLGCRNHDRALQAARRIRGSALDADVTVIDLDLASLDSVQRAAEQVHGEHSRLDLLINNAGLGWLPYSRTSDGLELTMATNHFGHFALTGQLLDLLWTPPPRGSSRSPAPRTARPSSSSRTSTTSTATTSRSPTRTQTSRTCSSPTSFNDDYTAAVLPRSRWRRTPAAHAPTSIATSRDPSAAQTTGSPTQSATRPASERSPSSVQLWTPTQSVATTTHQHG